MVLRLLVVAAAAGSLAVPAYAAPSDVNAQEFYVNARALEGKGMGAIFDKRLKPMIAQMKDAGTRARAANAAAAGSGKPIYCVPEGTKKKGMSSQQVIAMLGQVPEPERRSSSLAQVWQRILAREYPCR